MLSVSTLSDTLYSLLQDELRVFPETQKMVARFAACIALSVKERPFLPKHLVFHSEFDAGLQLLQNEAVKNDLLPVFHYICGNDTNLEDVLTYFAACNEKHTLCLASDCLAEQAFERYKEIRLCIASYALLPLANAISDALSADDLTLLPGQFGIVHVKKFKTEIAQARKQNVRWKVIAKSLEHSLGIPVNSKVLAATYQRIK